jgi:hypothetical protein
VVTTNALPAYTFFECIHCGVVGCTSSPDSAGSPFAGIEDDGGVQNLFTNNVIYKGTLAGIIMDAASLGNVVIGNVIRDPEGHGIYYGNGLGYANLSFNNIRNAGTVVAYGAGIRAPDLTGNTISDGVINGNSIVYCEHSGIILGGVQRSVCNYNNCIQNTHADNTEINIGIYDESTGAYSNDNLVCQNLCYEGDANPQTYWGLRIVNGSNNMVTMNYLKYGGKTANIADTGTTTDLKDWMVAGNKIA